MHLTWSLSFILGLTAFYVANAQTADKAANAKTKQILTYITSLPSKGKLLSGQFAGYSPDTFSNSIMDATKAATGQTPAIMACDWACGWNKKTPPENIIDYSCNAALKAHWNKGGLVSVNMHLPNPVFPDGGGYKERAGLNFADLVNTNTQTGQQWRKFLDRMALGLGDLQSAGVTVLFRPLHEMNGDWFYWCNQDVATYKNVWINMFNYLTNVKGLHNLIWVYSPDQSRTGPARYYPGADYVDIVALDAYVDDPNAMNGYSEMIALGKPFALGEVGPSTTNGAFDYNRWISAIQTKFPSVTYFLAWNDGWAPIKNQNGYSFYNNARLVNLGQINLADAGSTGGSTGTTSGSAVLHNFSRGVGQWKGTNIVGGPWQTNEQQVQATDSIKADIRLTAGTRYTLFTNEAPSTSLVGKRTLTARARVASWGFTSGGAISAKLYVKVGGAWKWYDSGAQNLNSGAFTTFSINLSTIPAAELGDVKEIGIDMTSNTNGAQTSVYVAYVTVEA